MAPPDQLREFLLQVAARYENLVGLKDSSGVLKQTAAYRTCAPDRELAVFVGPSACHSAVRKVLPHGCATRPVAP